MATCFCSINGYWKKNKLTVLDQVQLISSFYSNPLTHLLTTAISFGPNSFSHHIVSSIPTNDHCMYAWPFNPNNIRFWCLIYINSICIRLTKPEWSTGFHAINQQFSMQPYMYDEGNGFCKEETLKHALCTWVRDVQRKVGSESDLLRTSRWKGFLSYCW